MRHLTPLALLALTATAHAQLKVEQPTAQCAPNATPVLGIAVEHFFDGEYGIDFSNALEETLESRGYRVYPHFEYQLIEKATVVLKGRVDAWTSSNGTQTSRVGNARINILDVDSERLLLTLSQDAAWVVLKAPTLPAFVNMVVGEVTSRYCQLP
ncbi:hypothetical protein [Deinococcus planocerae]|uniref:hypothetical protein n=1 Tax=Deinococcus planocerae TaxID=1737569 RepID=UPI000C7EC61C|nr:hypothetical protein [Deinococcus planocerae]